MLSGENLGDQYEKALRKLLQPEQKETLHVDMEAEVKKLGLEPFIPSDVRVHARQDLCTQLPYLLHLSRCGRPQILRASLPQK